MVYTASGYLAGLWSPECSHGNSTSRFPYLRPGKDARTVRDILQEAHIALLLDSGASPKVVQRQLRHSDARTTLEIYGHVVGDAHREAVEKVASVLDAIGRSPSSVN
jgi:integrase